MIKKDRNKAVFLKYYLMNLKSFIKVYFFFNTIFAWLNLYAGSRKAM